MVEKKEKDQIEARGDTKSSAMPKKAMSKEDVASIETRQASTESISEGSEYVEEYIRRIQNLAEELKNETRSIEKQVARHTNLERALKELRDSTNLLTHAAQESRLAVQFSPDIDQSGKPNDCGESTRNCCVQLYMSRARALKSGGTEGDLEIIFAVRAVDQAGIFPSLTSYIKLDNSSVWAPINSPCGKFCVPCSGSLTVPLIVEALETGLAGEGRPEFGSTQGAITLSCNCPIVPQQIIVTLSGKWGSGHGNNHQVELEISGKRLSEGCC